MNLKIMVPDGKEMTPRQLLLDAVNQSEKWKSAILIYVDENDMVCLSHTMLRVVELFGLLEMAKSLKDFVDFMKEVDAKL